MSTSIKTRPSLWEKVKKEVMKSPKGGPPGKWSARKAQLSVSIYKAKGGGYVGKKSPKNSLAKWSSEKWGYINDNDTKKKPKRKTRKSKKSAKKITKRKSAKKNMKKSSKTSRKNTKKSERTSKKYGRYLPLEVRKSLTPSERRIENRKKGKRYGEWVPYSKSVSRKVRNVLRKS